MQSFDLRTPYDLDSIGQAVGLPVGPRKGRSKEKKEWYVLLNFLKSAVPAGIISLPVSVRNGVPPDEPDFIAHRGDLTVGWIEITEATDEADQKGMTAFENSGKLAALVGEFGGRFSDGAARPGLVWATDVVKSIKRKRGKAIYRSVPVPRHLLIYPNSNASFLLFDQDDERDAVDDLRAEVMKYDSALARLANACSIHILGAYLICFDLLGSMRLATRAVA
jgi:hypothetical protein